MRRHSVSRVINSLLWLAYLSADSVAVFVLGHLAANASGSHHLLVFWAPFLLLHLGGQDTITSFSLQDNELWRRHLLGLVTQAAVAVYVISISSWQDRRLLAATVLMFLSGCVKYAERILCLYIASPKFSKAMYWSLMGQYIHVQKGRSTLRLHDEHSDIQNRLFDQMLNVDMRLPGISTLDIVLSDTPVNRLLTADDMALIPAVLRSLKSEEERCRAYGYVSARFVRHYEGLYTKARFHFHCFGNMISLLHIKIVETHELMMRLIITFSVCLFPLLSSFITLVIFMFAEKGQLYSRVDITISYILLIGAITLEVASLSMTILSYFASTDSEASCPGLTCVAKYIHPAGLRRKHWSKMLAQYSMIRTYTSQDGMGIILSILPQWIGKHLHNNTLTRIPITKDLEKFVLDKLLDFGASKHSWNFATFRGQIALRRWPAMHAIINSADLPTSVLIWHIATEICYFGENSNTSPYESKITRI
ncbi:hypothetical protein BRADI_1g59370v3 [Brachypodium distachyon]|uniref:DUF4220 domain-containing protein n=1 Tax=Brachypodium distachyon TaxID=15368 RepID=A0A2K2DSG7_BRADI|nr:hypothetical protein BRADI_1g59370v3 [Brachypodium distachyon]